MKKITYQPRQVRIFLAILLLVLLFLAFRFFNLGILQHRLPFLAAPAIGIGIMIIFPKVFFPFYRAVLIVSGHIGNTVFVIISVLVYFLILTPIALGMKMFGKHFLNSAYDPSCTTYYDETEARHDLRKQF